LARKRKDAVNIEYFGDIEEQSLPRVLDNSYVRYSTHAILQRAIPNSKDGLKPAQRRLLYSMYRLGLDDGSKYCKCAKVCGQTSGDLHPHGESVIYPTLTRLVQDWVLRYPLIHGQGNFGTVDGLDAAAMRYTEARLSPYGIAVVDDVSADAVDFQPNYTETDFEPVILPGLFPNLLCNGGSGIAVSIACNFAPHNLREVASVIRECVTNKDVTVDRLLELMPGPDFPTGGVIRGQSSTRQYYNTGRGTITIDGIWETGADSKGNKTITVNELPYGSSPDKLAQQVADLVQNKKLDGVTDLKELSHRKDGAKVIKIVFTLSKTADEQLVIRTLLRNTCLRNTFSVNQTAIVNGRASENVSIIDLAMSYYNHRVSILKRRSEAELDKLTKRIHILEGLVNICSKIREVVDLILDSESPTDAKERLIACKYVKTDEQAIAVLEISLKKLTKLEVNQLLEQKDQAEKRASKLEKLLSSKSAMRDAVLKQLDDFVEKYGDDRRTQIGDDAETVSAQDLIKREDIVVSINLDGYVRRNGSFDQGSQYVETNTLNTIVFVTDTGTAYCKQGHDIPYSGKGKGTHIAQLIGCRPDESVIGIYELESAVKKMFVLTTKDGHVKRIKGTEFESKKRTGINIMKINDGSRLISAHPCVDNGELLVATEMGKGVCYPLSSVPIQGRNSNGVRAIKLATNDKIAQSVVVHNDFNGHIMFVASLGYVQKLPISKFRCYSGRQAVGKNTIDNVKFDRTGLVIAAIPIADNTALVCSTKDGSSVMLNPSEIRESIKPLLKVPPDKGDELIAVSTT
jgi:DNA gyrase subunit A